MTDSQNSKPPQMPGSVAVDPDELMGRVSNLPILRMVGISVAIHVVLIGITSIGFLMDCSKYKTWHPDVEIRRIAKEQRAEKLLKDREDAQKKLIADQKKKSKGGTSAGTKPASSIEKNVTRKSTTLPARSGVGLDDIDDIK